MLAKRGAGVCFALFASVLLAASFQLRRLGCFSVHVSKESKIIDENAVEMHNA